MEGFNSLVCFEDIFYSIITKNGYKEEKIKLHKEERIKKNCQTNPTLTIVCVDGHHTCQNWDLSISRKRKKASEGTDLNPDYNIEA